MISFEVIPNFVEVVASALIPLGRMNDFETILRSCSAE
jgi:hypothetical protein